MPPTILPLGPSHIDDAVRIECQSFSSPWSRTMLLDEIENPQAFCLAAEEDGALIGYACVRIVLDEGSITNVAVAPQQRRKGIASQLLDAIRAHAVDLELSFLTLEARHSNSAAIALYEKHGFQTLGLRPGYYEKPREDALIMTLYL